MPRTLKFDTNVRYVLLYCAKENLLPLLVLFFFSPVKFSVTDFSAPMRAKVFQFCVHLGHSG